MRFCRVFRLLKIKTKTVSGCIVPTSPGAARAGHVKVAHNAKIRTQNAADQSDRSARVEARRRRATRSVAPDAGRDRLGRTLPVVARSILTFTVPVSPERVRHRRSRARRRLRDRRIVRF